MKTLLIAMTIVGMGFVLSNVTGCSTSTDQPGTNYALGSYSTMVDASPDKVTDAAKKSAADLKLLNIVGTGTSVDGNVTAQNASGDNITIDIVQAGDNVSKVTIRVGATGDQAVSQQLIDRIKSHLNWF